MTPAAPTGGYRGGTSRSALAGALVLGIAIGWNFTGVGAVATELADDYRVSLATVGLLSTVVILATIVLQLPAGRASDRVGPRRVALAGTAVLVLANVVALPEPAAWQAFVARIFVGVGMSFCYITGVEYLRRAGATPLWQGIFGGVTGVGSGLALAIVPQLDRWLEWRAPFASGAAIALVAVLMLAAAPADPPRAAHVERRLSLHLLTDRRLVRLSALLIGANSLCSVVGVWVVALLVEAGGYSTAVAGAAGSLVLLGWIVTRPLSGWLMHNRPELTRPAIAVSVVLGAGGTLALAAAGPVPLAVAGSALVGLAAGIPWTYAFVAASDLRPDAPTTAIALVNAVGLVAMAVGIQLVGLSFELPGDGRVGFVAIAALWAASIFFLPKRATHPAVRAADVRA